MSDIKNKKIREINVDEIDLERLKIQVAEIPSILHMAHSRSGASIHVDDPATIREEAILSMKEQTSEQVAQIYRKLTPLISELEELKQRVLLSEIIYTSHMQFDPIIGETYYLYKKSDGTSLLSMVGPDEWGKSHPYKEYEGAVELLADHTWKFK